MTGIFGTSSIKRLLISLGLTVFLWSGSMVAGLAAPNQLTSEEIREGWILLFDGESMFGWQAESKVDWRIEEGAIVASSGEMGLLRTLATFGDFVLRLEYRADVKTNSGIFLRTAPTCTDPGPAGQCYEFNIAPPDNPFPSGSLVRLLKTEAAVQEGDWHDVEIRVEGGQIAGRIDGADVLSFTDPVPLGRGHIGLQLNQGKVEFRSIKLKPLGLEPIFNGRNLDGWTVYPGNPSVYSVTDQGEMRVINGRGQIETEKQFGDFVLQLGVKVNGDALNSGIFFRSIKGEFWMGYESQIQNGFKNGDRSDPVDFGTGAIYRRQPARVIVSNDHEWFYKTIVAAGPTLCVWVNGYPVTAWTDTREPDPNPRKGLRTAPGTIIIQGHDPTTDLLFRDLEAIELRGRARSSAEPLD
ncbi:MAG: DUF1080 domain-containing protein [Acidobacteriota bacterium]|nr:MAG: DUF1080 domain-containing protein [Acidobacteriota bacterium]